MPLGTFTLFRPMPDLRKAAILLMSLPEDQAAAAS
jgi:flagellar motor switch protein FliG